MQEGINPSKADVESGRYYTDPKTGITYDRHIAAKVGPNEATWFSTAQGAAIPIEATLESKLEVPVQDVLGMIGAILDELSLTFERAVEHEGIRHDRREHYLRQTIYTFLGVPQKET